MKKHQECSDDVFNESNMTCSTCNEYIVDTMHYTIERGKISDKMYNMSTSKRDSCHKFQYNKMISTHRVITLPGAMKQNSLWILAILFFSTHFICIHMFLKFTTQICFHYHNHNSYIQAKRMQK